MEFQTDWWRALHFSRQGQDKNAAFNMFSSLSACIVLNTFLINILRMDEYKLIYNSPNNELSETKFKLKKKYLLCMYSSIQNTFSEFLKFWHRFWPGIQVVLYTIKRIDYWRKTLLFCHSACLLRLCWTGPGDNMNERVSFAFKQA